VVTSLLLGALEPWLAGARPVATEVFRWRYSKPRHPDERGALMVTGDPGPLVLAGDALAGAKVEGAVTSGLGAARLLAGERPAADSAR
jgi:predicted NAD/FAD-dependent oxidoreductase